MPIAIVGLRSSRAGFVAILLAMAIGGCLPQAEAPTEPTASSPVAPTESATAQTGMPSDSSPAASQTPVAESPSPTTRTATISVEGESTQVVLERYESPDFVTDLPEDFVAEPSASDEGRGVRFNFSPTGTPNEAAYVHVFFPSESISAAALTTQMTEENGLLASNGWELVDRDTSPPYDWAQTAIDYQQPNEEMSTGTIWVGEQQGKAFLVFTHFPAEYAEGFVPRADLILENFQLR
jgi:hypothetical protein